MDVKPIFRWLGGKGQLLDRIVPLLPEGRIAFRDLTFGGGALFARLAAEGRIGQAYLSDFNWRLIAAYAAVKDHLDEVVSMLEPVRDTPEEYARARAALNALRPCQDDVAVGALVIQLNRTSFNGLWRENARGEYNAPRGGGVRGDGAPILDAKFGAKLSGMRDALRTTGAVLDPSDFGQGCYGARLGDLIFADPPYLPRAKASFTSYVGGRGFDEAEHRRLALHLAYAGERGAKFLVASSDTPLAREIYSPLGEVVEVRARRAVNSDGAGRGAVGELLVKNY